MRKKIKFTLITFLLFTLALSIQAQMKAPEEWLNYEDVLQVMNNQRFYDFDVTCIYTSAIANVFWPGEKARFIFQVVNHTSEPISVHGYAEVIRYGTKGRANDLWWPEMYSLATVQKIPLEISISPNGFENIPLEPDLPETFGGYAIVFDLGKHGRRLATSVVRTLKPSLNAIQYPKQSLDDLGPDFLSRIGVQAIRMGVSYIPTTHRDYQSEMAKLDKKLSEYKAKNITVLLMFMEGPALIPLGTPRSFLDNKNVFLKTKQDYVWLPSLDNDFQKFVKNICVKHGWPRGCVTGVHLWNEPWEGISISGWQSDMLRYREIYKAMANGVLEARQQGVDVLIGGCDSNSNAWDKLFSDGSDEYLPIFDFLSIHYQGMESPCLYPSWNNRKYHKGRVLIWDTESWVGNTDDRIGVVAAVNRSAGYDRSMGIYGGYMISRPHTGEEVQQQIRTKDGWKTIDAIPMVWSPAAALGAVQHFLGERNFSELLFKKGLPWVMVFDGSNNNPDDGTIVICGDIGEAFGYGNVLFRGVRSLTEAKEKEQISKQLALTPLSSPERRSLEKLLEEYHPIIDGKMILKADPSFILYDFYGNPIPPQNNKIEIPLTFQAFYIRTNGKKGSYDRLKKALSEATIIGYEPVEIIAKDMHKRVEDKPVLEIQLNNILNKNVSGKLSIQIDSLTVTYPENITLKPYESLVIPVKVNGGKVSKDNLYPLEVRFDAGNDGYSFHREIMRVNIISRLTPKIDGNLDEWTSALPQVVKAGNTSISVTEAAWYPFKQFSGSEGGIAVGYLAYDDSFFYFAAKVADATPHPGTYRFATRNDDEFFYPDTAYMPDFNTSFKMQEQHWNAADDDLSALENPNGKGRVLSFWEPDANNIGIGVIIALPEDKLTKVAFYLPNIDTWHTHVEVIDLQTNEVLLKHNIEKLWNGCYLVLQMSGKVRVTFKGNWWYNVKLAGIFFDKTDIVAPRKTTVIMDKEDFDTRGNWKGVYGQSGYWIFGTKPMFPSEIRVEAVNQVNLIPLIWPEGVRHYTYRKDPVLPDNSTGMGFASDNIQIAFNVIPLGEDGYYSHPKGTMPRYIGYKCTDYEYALNQVAPEYGGGTEIWRLLVPGMPEKHFYPRQPKSPYDGPVKGGKLIIRHDGNMRITECAIPWSEIPDVKRALDENKTIKFSFRVNDNGNMGACMELARERSVSKMNSRAFHASWREHWANEVEFVFD